MIAESIEVGEMSDTYDDWKDQIREDWESWQNKPTRPGSPGSHTKENGMKSLKKNLQDLTGENIDLQKELPEIGLDDLNIIDTKTFGEEITLWLCNDEDRNRYIIRDDSAGLRGICLFSSRDDQLTFAAWNVDFDITALTDWIDDETMTLAIEDAKAHHWEFSGPFNSRSPR
jgi:hypothetical protein